MTNSNVGKWARWNDGPPRPYGDVLTYEIAADIFAAYDCRVVQDWGCGLCFFRSYVEARGMVYIGVDGSPSPSTNLQADLTEFIHDQNGNVHGILLRHVLEHNHEWKKILANALLAFRNTLIIVLFTPWSLGETQDIAFDHLEIDVPDLSLNRDEFMAPLDGFIVDESEALYTHTTFGIERIITVRRFRPPTVRPFIESAARARATETIRKHEPGYTPLMETALRLENENLKAQLENVVAINADLEKRLEGCRKDLAEQCESFDHQRKIYEAQLKK